MLLHASCVSYDSKAILITGQSGTGKSDLSLRLIYEGALLVADDQTQLRVEQDQLMASAPPNLAGLLEVRQVGIVRVPFQRSACVALYLELVDTEEESERLPSSESRELLGVRIPYLRLSPFLASTTAKIYAALTYPRVD